MAGEPFRGGGLLDIVRAKLDDLDLALAAASVDDTCLDTLPPILDDDKGEREAAETGEVTGEVMDLVIFPLSGLMYVDDTARCEGPCGIAGEAGMGFDTTLGEPTVSVDDAAASAAFARRFFSAIIADIVVDRLAIAGRAAGSVSAAPLLDCPLAFSNCFLAAPSKLSTIAFPLAGQIPLNDQNASRASSRTEGFTSPSPFLIALSSISSRPGVVSITLLDR